MLTLSSNGRAEGVAIGPASTAAAGFDCKCMKLKRIAIENRIGVNRYCPLQRAATANI